MKTKLLRKIRKAIISISYNNSEYNYIDVLFYGHDNKIINHYLYPDHTKKYIYIGDFLNFIYLLFGYKKYNRIISQHRRNKAKFRKNNKRFKWNKP